MTNEAKLSIDLSLPNPVGQPLSFRLRIFHNDAEFDYTKSYSCMIANSKPSVDGRIVLFSIVNAEIYNNLVYGLTPGEYRIACIIENLGGGVPNPLRRFINITLPLTDDQGKTLPETARIVELRFGGTSENGVIF